MEAEDAGEVGGGVGGGHCGGFWRRSRKFL